MNPILLLVLTLPQQAAEITLDNVPPVVVNTRPIAGSADVSVKTTEVQVTFSKLMRDQSWSFIQISKNSFPPLTGRPRYLEDGKTWTVPVKLEAGKTYAIWLNTPKFKNFRDKKGRSAVPYLLVFRTAGK